MLYIFYILSKLTTIFAVAFAPPPSCLPSAPPPPPWRSVSGEEAPADLGPGQVVPRGYRDILTGQWPLFVRPLTNFLVDSLPYINSSSSFYLA